MSQCYYYNYMMWNEYETDGALFLRLALILQFPSIPIRLYASAGTHTCTRRTRAGIIIIEKCGGERNSSNGNKK